MTDRHFGAALALLAFIIVPWMADEYWLQAVLIPFLIFALAALGLNLLTGYAGLVSLGTGGFMATGAYVTYKLATSFPDLNILVIFVLAGLVAAAVGVLFGLPSLRIKGFYLAVATLAAQFFLTWLFNKVGWFYNHNPSGTITAPPRTVAGYLVTGPEAAPEARYLVALAVVAILTLAARNIVGGHIGRSWMAIRDREIAAEIIGIRLLPAKLLAFAVSSFYCGIAGALLVFVWLGSAQTEAFEIIVSFEVLFMIIIGGLGSIWGAYLGAAFVVALPILLTNAPSAVGIAMPVDLAKHIEVMVFGALIVAFLIAEPRGLAQLLPLAWARLRRRAFPGQGGP